MIKNERSLRKKIKMNIVLAVLKNYSMPACAGNIHKAARKASFIKAKKLLENDTELLSAEADIKHSSDNHNLAQILRIYFECRVKIIDMFQSVCSINNCYLFTR